MDAHVQVDQSLFRPAEADVLLGDARKAQEKLGWKPTSRTSESDPVLGKCGRLDATNLDAVQRVLREVSPTHVVHLSGISATRRVGEHPLRAWETNVTGTLNLAHTILAELPQCWLNLASGEAGLARRLLSWVPTRDFKATLAEVLAYWRRHVAHPLGMQPETLIQ